MDIAFIIRHVRILRYFLKTVLDKDQRLLLKLKSTEYIPSSDDENQPIKGEKKHKRKELMLQRYVENLQKKNLSKQDVRLLEVLGFQDALKIITDEKRRQMERDQLIGQNSKLNEFMPQAEIDAFEMENYNNNDLGLAGYGGMMSKTKTQRNPDAKSHAETWQINMN